jgi:hypothetical protein
MTKEDIKKLPIPIGDQFRLISVLPKWFSYLNSLYFKPSKVL